MRGEQHCERFHCAALSNRRSQRLLSLTALHSALHRSLVSHYLAALSARIVRKQAALPASDRKLNLQAVAIGNGLVDALHQYGSYAPFALQHGIISQSQHDLMEAQLPACIDQIRNCSIESTAGWHHCLKAHVLCSYTQLLPLAASGVNVYDVRRPCGDQPLCYDFSHIEMFLSQEHVSRALHTHGVRWRECNQRVNERLTLAGDWLLSFSGEIAAVLDCGVRVVVYAGEFDLICNIVGQKRWVEQMKWSGREGFRRAEETEWRVDGEEAGTARAYGPLTLVIVKDAGSALFHSVADSSSIVLDLLLTLLHSASLMPVSRLFLSHMVPLDQPHRSLDLLDRIISGRAFDHKSAID